MVELGGRREPPGLSLELKRRLQQPIYIQARPPTCAVSSSLGELMKVQR